MTDTNEQAHRDHLSLSNDWVEPFAVSAQVTEPLFPTAPVEQTAESWNGDPWSVVSSTESYTPVAGNAAPFKRAPVFNKPLVDGENTPRWTAARPLAAASTSFGDEPTIDAQNGHSAPDASPPSSELQPTPTLTPLMVERQATFERRMAVIMDFMQHGAWPQALEKLQALRGDFAEAAHLDALIAEAELRASLMATWAHQIKGRRLTVGQEWFLRRSLPFGLVLALFLGIALFYQNFLGPSRQVLAMARANQAQIQEASGLAQMGDFKAAMALYQAVLARDPGNQMAQQGIAEVQKQAGLAANYDIALHVMRRGNLERAAALLMGIRAVSPAYRDVEQQLNRLATLRQAEAAFRDAEEAYAQRRWLSAVQGYERAAQISADYRTAEVQAHLDEAYFYAAEQLLARWPTADVGPEQARAYLRRAQSAGSHREAASNLLATLDVYARGEQAVRNSDLREAINLWRSIYETQPGYLGGFLAEQLYRAYLTLAAQARAGGDTEYARQLYTLALQLQVRDISEAQTQLAVVSAPTPTPLPTATPVPAPIVYAPPPTPTPTATATPAMQYAGWIAFRSTREGSEWVYLMRPDGSEQQRAPEEIRLQLDVLYEQGRRSPDGARVLVVQSEPGRSDANLYIHDNTGQGVAMLTNDNGDEYDPVWAPNGQWVAYVANHPGNDEIFLMRPDGSDKRRLTWNEWEWDKHPTWSPDSSQIAFFSNRTGRRQIWVMSYDGTNQRNLSNNVFDDWDPVWLK